MRIENANGIWAWLAIVIACESITSAHSAEYQKLNSNSKEEEEVLAEVQVTAGLLSEALSETAYSVTVVTREQVAVYSGRSIADLLSDQAGISIDRGPANGGYGAVYLRGADPSHVVVLIDGIRQNDPLSSRGSAVNVNALSLDDIERIEIVRGATSVANGEAVAGAIHLFTRQEGDGAHVGGAIGGNGLKGFSLGASLNGWRVSGSHREEGEAEGGFSRVQSLNFGWDGKSGSIVELHASARLGKSFSRGFPDDSGGERYSVIRTLNEMNEDYAQASVQARVSFEAGALDVVAAAVDRNSEERNPGVAPGVRDLVGLPALTGVANYTREELLAVWRSAAAAADGVSWGIGAQLQREKGTHDGHIEFEGFGFPTVFQIRRSTEAIFGEVGWRQGLWAVRGGLRLENRGEAASQERSELLPMASVRRELQASAGQVGVSYSRAFKPPSFYALGHPLVGNPALHSERAEQFEAFYSNESSEKWPVRVTVFRAQYRDLIDFDAGPPPHLVNRAKIGASGIEVRGAHRLENGWELKLDGMRMSVRDSDGESRLRYRPTWLVSAGLWIPMVESAGLSVRLRHVGKFFDSSIPTGEVRLGSRTLCDLTYRRAWGGVIAGLSVENVFDSHAEEVIGSRVEGRRAVVSLHWKTP